MTVYYMCFFGCNPGISSLYFRAITVENTYRAYQKKMAIRDYLAIFLRSDFTKSIQKTMAIDRKKACITIIATGSRGSRQDRDRIARIAAGCSEMK